MAKSGQTGKAVLKNAGMLLAKTDYGLDVWMTLYPAEARKVIKGMAASLINQAPNKERAKLQDQIKRDKREATTLEKVTRAPVSEVVAGVSDNVSDTDDMGEIDIAKIKA